MSTETLAPTPDRSRWRRLTDILGARSEAAARRRAERTCRMDLAALDDHLLRDLGFTRDQIAEVARTAAQTLSPEARPRARRPR